MEDADKVCLYAFTLQVPDLQSQLATHISAINAIAEACKMHTACAASVQSMATQSSSQQPLWPDGSFLHSPREAACSRISLATGTTHQPLRTHQPLTHFRALSRSLTTHRGRGPMFFLSRIQLSSLHLNNLHSYYYHGHNGPTIWQLPVFFTQQYLSQSTLFSLPHKLQAHILWGEFIDFTELLQAVF